MVFIGGTMDEEEKAEIKKMIVEEFKKEGLDIAEDAAIRLAKMGFSITKKVLGITKNRLDDLLIPVIGVIEKPVLNLLDKIDNREN